MIELQTDGLKPHRCLAVAFTGISHGLGGIPFEFRRSFAGADCAALFIRDAALQWYQYPDGDESSCAQIAKAILAAKEQVGAERLVMIGNSMGGFGALLYSCFVKTDQVLAFVPQTVILPAIAEKMGDRRWADKWRAIPEKPFGDLAALPEPSGQRTLIFGDKEKLDRAHAAHLSAAWRCESLVVKACGHDAAATLRERGELGTLLAGAVSGEG